MVTSCPAAFTNPKPHSPLTASTMSLAAPYILLAEDDPDDREFFCAAMLRWYPHVAVRTVEDGDVALDYLNSCDPGAFPACILLDFKMPRFSAPQVLEAIGKGTRYARIPRIVWSTSERQKDMDECLQLGAFRFVVKPVSDEQLDKLILSLELFFYASASPFSSSRIS